MFSEVIVRKLFCRKNQTAQFIYQQTQSVRREGRVQRGPTQAKIPLGLMFLWQGYLWVEGLRKCSRKNTSRRNAMDQNIPANIPFGNPRPGVQANQGAGDGVARERRSVSCLGRSATDLFDLLRTAASSTW